MTFAPNPPGRPVSDAQLRACGFVIVSRPRSGLAVWRRNGRNYAEPIAAKITRRELADRKRREADE